MDFEDIQRQRKNLEDDLNDAEVAKKLTEDAQELGEENYEKSKRLWEQSKELFEEFDKRDWLNQFEGESGFENKEIFGLDGSAQYEGGNGSVFYILWATAIVHFRNGEYKTGSDSGIGQESTVNEEQSDITGSKEMQELGGQKVTTDLSTEMQSKEVNEEQEISKLTTQFMLLKETLRLETIEPKEDKAVIFIDGPIVDPPGGISDEYAATRCKAIKDLLDDGHLVIGVAKRVKGSFYKQHVMDRLPTKLEGKVDNFINDQSLITRVMLREGNENPLYVDPIEFGYDNNETYQGYKNEGLSISSTFLKYRRNNKVIRLDIPYTGEELSDERLEEVIDITCSTIIPGIQIPLPVKIADQKCGISRDTAELFYNQITNEVAKENPKYFWDEIQSRRW